MSIYCQLCQKEMQSLHSLARHFTQSHHYKSKQYYDEFIKSPQNGICVECGSNTKFIALGSGYRETCGNSCAGIKKRRLLKNDDVKFDNFVEKVKKNVTTIWSNRTNEERELVLSNTRIGYYNKITTLNTEDRKKKLSRYYTCDAITIEKLNSIGRNQCFFNWKNGMSGYGTTLKGRYTPKNPKKYVGDASVIFYRSSWERRVMTWFDDDINVLEWSSEELVIPYISPVDNRVHRYFPDFLAKMKTKDGIIKKIVVEVKPEKQTKPPEKKKKVTRRFITEIATWGVNEAKWKAATEYCLDRGWEFKIISEKDIFGKDT